MATAARPSRGAWRLASRPLALAAAGGVALVAVAEEAHANITATGIEALLDTESPGGGNSSSSISTGRAASADSRYDAPMSLLDMRSFDYHKPAFPLDWDLDGVTILCSSIGLVIAASGGIGGGGILVPLFMLLLKFRPKHAIALSNFTILGGAIANTVVNARKRHPQYRDRMLIDWDLILIMEPLTIFGAVFGSLLSKVLPNAVLTALLVVILAFMGHRTLKKGLKMWHEESGCSARVVTTGIELKSPDDESASGGGHAPLAVDAEEADPGMTHPYSELQAESGDERLPAPPQHAQRAVGFKITALTCCFVGTCALTILKGGGHFRSPFGFHCGSSGFWMLYFGSLPWVLAFAFYFRSLLVSEFEQKVRTGHIFTAGEVQWDSQNTLRYPAICAISGLLAGLFGVGGGIVKGPLMLEMGIMPAVASASAAAMILFTSAAASISFIAFGLLHPMYGAMFFLLGILCTAFGQYTVGQWVKRHERQSPIVLSIGLVILLSSLLVSIDMVAEARGPRAGDMLRVHGVCTAEA